WRFRDLERTPPAHAGRAGRGDRVRSGARGRTRPGDRRATPRVDPSGRAALASQTLLTLLVLAPLGQDLGDDVDHANVHQDADTDERDQQRDRLARGLVGEDEHLPGGYLRSRTCATAEPPPPP